jgi:hypothetical protein
MDFKLEEEVENSSNNSHKDKEQDIIHQISVDKYQRINTLVPPE